MPYYEFLWTDEIVAHLEEHGVSTADFEAVVTSPDKIGRSRSSGRPCCWGETPDGRSLFCVFEKIGVCTVVPVTAYEISNS